MEYIAECVGISLRGTEYSLKGCTKVSAGDLLKLLTLDQHLLRVTMACKNLMLSEENPDNFME